jgi:hypothetical protein
MFVMKKGRFYGTGLKSYEMRRLYFDLNSPKIYKSIKTLCGYSLFKRLAYTYPLFIRINLVLFKQDMTSSMI